MSRYQRKLKSKKNIFVKLFNFLKKEIPLFSIIPLDARELIENMKMISIEFVLCKLINYYFCVRIFDFDTYKEYHTERKGILGSGIILGAFIPTTEESKKNDWPEIQIHGLPHLFASFSDYQKTFNFDTNYWNDLVLPEFKGKDGISFSYCLLRPKSRLVIAFYFVNDNLSL